ncbi:hypothetical protein EP18_05170 [Lysinibacillus sphaericus]|nr:hypothetical protein [Lysinibacillus sphaericus]KEK12716.1 hypothetical protein EP18_05170 [Lysinibacillus sphaericus]
MKNPFLIISLVFIYRRETWSSTEIKFPCVPTAKEVKSFPSEGMPPWVHNYDMKIVQGAPLALSQPYTKDTSHSVTLQWIQDEPRRPIGMWSPEGKLLATTSQLVYYKE